MLVGGYLSREERLSWVAVALWEVAQDVVVGPVLFDDVDHVLDPGVVEAGRFCRVDSGSQAVVFDDLAGMFDQAAHFTGGDDRDRAVDDVVDVRACPFARRDGVWVFGPDAFGAGHEEASVMVDDSGREPSGGDVAFELGAPEVDDGDSVHVRAGDIKGALVGGKFQLKGASAGDATELGGSDGDCVDDFVGGGIDDADSIAGGIGHVEPGLVTVKKEANGRLSDFDRAFVTPVTDVDDIEESVTFTSDVGFVVGVRPFGEIGAGERESGGGDLEQFFSGVGLIEGYGSFEVGCMGGLVVDDQEA